jgi:hypothetical protein
MSQLAFTISERRSEDDKVVRQVMKSLLEDNYDSERLSKLIQKANEYENKHKGSRGNRCVLRAAELVLLQIKKA